MQTPYGAECSYYYEDFNRGRNVQECRLAIKSGTAGNWAAGVCRDCPVPSIQRANSCEYLLLEGRVSKGFIGFGRRMTISTWCRKMECDVAEPEIGCGHCHGDNPLLAQLFGEGSE
ncbi:MAG: hypothetical protein ACE5FI_02325 [Anaerolineales bacterium]